MDSWLSYEFEDQVGVHQGSVWFSQLMEMLPLN